MLSPIKGRPTASDAPARSAVSAADRPRAKAKDDSRTTATARRLKLWWRFHEVELTVDQEFFFSLPRRKESTLTRTESGGFRFASLTLDSSDELFIQGTSFASIERLAAVISGWVAARRSRIVLVAEDGEQIEFVGKRSIAVDRIAEQIRRLSERSDEPLRIEAEELTARGV